jgi:UDP-2,3-diacylglucosamine pyrophosphatase LpxH
MEFLTNKKIALTVITVLIFESCSKDEGYFSLNETVDQRVEQSLDWDSKNPEMELDISSDEYTIFCMADSHVGTTSNLDRFFSIAKESNAAAVIMAGDLCSGRVSDYDVLEKHMHSGDSLPRFMVAGNHDLHFAGWNEYFNRFGSSTYYFSVRTPEGSDIFICLDTSEGTLGKIQFAWLSNVLKNLRQNYRRCIVITHNNLFRVKQAESTNPLPEEICALVKLFTINHIELVITGHDHRKDDRLFGITRYIVMDPLEDKADNAGYFVLTIRKGELKYNFESIL